MATTDLAKGIDGNQLREDCPVAGTVDDMPVMLVRHGGKICALAGNCTHLGAPMAEGIVVDGEIRCPWHHARFALDDGEAVGAAAFAPLDTYDVVERNGRVTVTGKRAPAKSPASTPVKDPGHVVIVGGGGAGHACAEMLARAGVIATVIDADPAAPYDRTMCSKQFLAGDVERHATALPIVAGMRAGATVQTIDAEVRRVTLNDGEIIDYDVLVLATGAQPTPPSFDGAERADVFQLRTLDDAQAIIVAAQQASRAIVVGASYIGLETAASLTQRGLAVTVIGDEAVPLAGTAGREVGDFVRSTHEDHGVVFRMNAKLVAFDGSVATLDDGSQVAGSLVVLGTGVAPDTDLAEAAGIMLADEKAGGGIAVDGAFRTSVAGIHAIGDIANVPDPRLNHPTRVEHWVVAQRHGQWLARFLTGEIEGVYGDTPFFWSGHYDTNLRYVGHVDSPDDRHIAGTVDAGDFAVHLAEQGTEQALLTCGRDRESLQREADWDRN